MNKFFASVLAALLIICILPTKQTSANDIANHQMAAELSYWAKKQVILPDAKGKYNPDKFVTRGEFATYITRALKLPANESRTFKDIKAGTQLAKDISAAAAANILSGYEDGTFKPNAAISRQHMVAMMHKALTYKKIPEKKVTLNFIDNKKINKQFTTAIATNVYYGIIRGSQTSKGLSFNPQQNATIAHAAAFLYRMERTMTTGTAAVPVQPQQPSPEVDPEPDNGVYYYVGYIQNGEIVKNPKKYNSYKSALEVYEENKSITLLYRDNKLIKTSNSAITVIRDATSGGDTASIYLTKDFKNAYTYLVEGSELGYNGSNEDYVIVKVGDIIGYMKPSEVLIVPTATLANRSYYSVNDGSLVHSVYNYTTKTMSGSYQVGRAPSFMKEGEKYYSIDGVQFRNSSGDVVGTHYNYYQFASVRKHTEYTAKDLNEIIRTLLAERERINPTKYKNASKESKLIGLGSFLKEVEETHKVNAFFILATAMHESDYGMSGNAQKKNNLFGIRVFDSSPQDGSKYKTPEDSVYAFLNEYMNKNYIPQSGSYAKGGAPGTKNSGMNVHYASDAFWGSKIAGHMYRMDERFGRKEYKSAASIGMVLNANENVQTYVGSSATSKVAFTYKAKPTGEANLFGYPVIIMEEKVGSDGKTWYKVFSDNSPQASNYTRYVWLPASDVKKITTN